MPISASTPRIATNPKGAPVGSKAATTPIRPSGATAMTMNINRKLCIWIITSVSITSSISGATAAIGPWLSALDSTTPATSMPYPGGCVTRSA